MTAKKPPVDLDAEAEARAEARVDRLEENGLRAAALDVALRRPGAPQVLADVLRDAGMIYRFVSGQAETVH